MPTYRFECRECCEEFSFRRRMKNRNDQAICPSCGSSRTKRAMSRFQVGGGRSSGGGGG